MQICVQSPSGGLNLYLNVLTVLVICSPLSGQCIELAKHKFPHLQGLKLADSSGGHSLLDVDLLIGADSYWQVVTGQIKQGELGGSVAINTHLGWVLPGSVHGLSQVESSSVNLSSTHVLHVDTYALEHDSVEESCPIKQELSRFGDIESLGIVPRALSVYQNFLEDVKFTGERYEVCLPWREDHSTLPDNFYLSKWRLKSLLQCLRSKMPILEEYDKVIRDQEARGMMENVSADDTDIGRIHYLPHHEVIREDKQTT